MTRNLRGECPHVVALRAYLRDHQISVWSECGEEPNGWVKVHCHQCSEPTVQDSFDYLCNDPDEDDPVDV